MIGGVCFTKTHEDLMRPLLFALVLFAACAPATPNTELIATGIAATQSAELESAPTLLAPADGAAFDSPMGITLNWDWSRPLQGREMYDVRVWRGDDPHYGITWSDASQFDLADWLRHQKPGEFQWSVAVIIGGDAGQVERTISSEAPALSFTVSNTALPTPTPFAVSDIVQVPPGFEVRPYARPDLATLPTSIAFGPDGALYMLTYSGDLFMMRDADGDQFAESSQRIYLDDAEHFYHAVGLAFHDDVLYVSDSGKISTVEDSDGDGMLDAVTPIVEDLISLRYPDHSNNGIAFYDDKLYVPVGAATDHGPVTSDLEAAILRMNPDGSDVEVFASGFRNPYDLAFSPSGELFAGDNNPDSLDDTLRYLPPEELNYVRQGRHYGFPDAFGFMEANDENEPPVVEFFPSVATTGLVYYDAEAFPPPYHDGVFMALWGTAAPTPQERSLTNGRMVVFVTLNPTSDGGYRGAWDVFAWFRQSSDYRPIDVIVGEDGALYIAEWTTSSVYRVAYVGMDAALPESPTPTPEILPTASDEQLALGESVYLNGAQDAPACVSCHLLDPNGRGLGPSLLGLRAVASQRVSGLGAVDYVRRSITHPNEYVVPGYNAGYMYQDYAARLTDDQLDALVAYVLLLE